MPKIKFNIERYNKDSLELLEAGLISAFQEVCDNCLDSGFCVSCSLRALCNDLYVGLAKLDTMYSRKKGER